MRRWTLASLGAQEIAAQLAGVLETDTPAEDGGTVTAEKMEILEFVRNAIISMPRGWKFSQVDSKQPGQNHIPFKEDLVGEIGRGINMPFTVMSGDARKANFSAAQLERLLYHTALWVERGRMQDICLSPCFEEWIDEAALIDNYLPAGLPPFEDWEVDWHWDGFGAVDPVKDATAKGLRLGKRLSTYASELAADGLDWEEVLEQQAREEEFARSLGLQLGYGETAVSATAAEDPADDEDLDDTKVDQDEEALTYA